MKTIYEHLEQQFKEQLELDETEQLELPESMIQEYEQAAYEMINFLESKIESFKDMLSSKYDDINIELISSNSNSSGLFYSMYLTLEDNDYNEFKIRFSDGHSNGRSVNYQINYNDVYNEINWQHELLIKIDDYMKGNN